MRHYGRVDANPLLGELLSTQILGPSKLSNFLLQCQEGIYLYKLLYTEEMEETHTFILQIRRESIIM